MIANMAIQAKGLEKTYREGVTRRKKFNALKGISLEVFGRIRVVHTAVVAPRDIPQFFGHRIDHLKREWHYSYYARPWPRHWPEDQDDDDV